ESTIRYSTYSLANKIEVKLDGVWFQAGSFDGASDMVIKGINYQYVLDSGVEYLTLYFEESVELDNFWWLRKQQETKSNPLKNSELPTETITILKNSVLIFVVDTEKR
ncbi:MAG: hypothetical protein AAGM67_00980, partial [Bacteroidota bacterium]